MIVDSRKVHNFSWLNKHIVDSACEHTRKVQRLSNATKAYCWTKPLIGLTVTLTQCLMLRSIWRVRCRCTIWSFLISSRSPLLQRREGRHSISLWVTEYFSTRVPHLHTGAVGYSPSMYNRTIIQVDEDCCYSDGRSNHYKLRKKRALQSLKLAIDRYMLVMSSCLVSAQVCTKRPLDLSFCSVYDKYVEKKSKKWYMHSFLFKMMIA